MYSKPQVNNATDPGFSRPRKSRAGIVYSTVPKLRAHYISAGKPANDGSVYVQARGRYLVKVSA